MERLSLPLGGVQEEFFTTEYTEFHGEKNDFRIKTPWYSVPSVVNSYLLDNPKLDTYPFRFFSLIFLISLSKSDSNRRS
jgi:hypothetical protein